MKCPVCADVNLVMSERQGVEIDYCPGCRGVWLDRGELDKIIDRANAIEQNQAPIPKEPQYIPPPQPAYQGHNHQGHGYGHAPHYKKKKSLLSEIFDFD